MNQRIQAELNYQAARLTVQRMLDEGIISPVSAERLITKFIKRYQPLIGGFLHEADVHTPNPIHEEEPA